MTLRYEPFTVEIIADIIVLGMEMHEESAQRDVPFDIEYAAQNTYLKVIQNPENAFGCMVFEEDRPVAMIVGFLSTYEYAPVMYAYNAVWYVTPEKRGTPVAIKLLKKFEKWAKARGARDVLLGIASGVNTSRTGKAIKRLGYETVGNNYALKL